MSHTSPSTNSTAHLLFPGRKPVDAAARIIPRQRQAAPRLDPGRQPLKPVAGRRHRNAGYRYRSRRSPRPATLWRMANGPRPLRCAWCEESARMMKSPALTVASPGSGTRPWTQPNSGSVAANLTSAIRPRGPADEPDPRLTRPTWISAYPFRIPATRTTGRHQNLQTGITEPRPHARTFPRTDLDPDRSSGSSLVLSRQTLSGAVHLPAQPGKPVPLPEDAGETTA